MAAAYAARAAAAAALAGFAADARARAEREDLLRFQLGELDAARPVPGEDAGAGRRTRAPARRRALLRGDRGRRGDAVRGRRRRQRADRGGVARPRAAGGAGSGAGAAGRAAARRGGRRRGRGARSRPLRARRPLRSGAAGGDRGTAVPAVAPVRANTAAPWPIWPRGARRSPPSWPRSPATTTRWPRARRRPTRRTRARAAAAAALSASRKQAAQQPGEEGRRHPARARLRERAGCPSLLEARELGADRRRPRALPVRAQPGRGAAPAGARSPRAASCRGSCWR